MYVVHSETAILTTINSNCCYQSTVGQLHRLSIGQLLESNP